MLVMSHTAVIIGKVWSSVTVGEATGWFMVHVDPCRGEHLSVCAGVSALLAVLANRQLMLPSEPISRCDASLSCAVTFPGRCPSGCVHIQRGYTVHTASFYTEA